MPELPEVETTLRGISPHIKYQTIIQVIIRESRLRWAIPTHIKKILAGQTIQKVERRGKYLILKMQRGSVLIHLGMSGHLRILTSNLPPRKHDHVDLIFQNKKILRFSDPRRFGAFLWTEDDTNKHPLIKNLGIEPFNKDFTGNYLWLLAQRKRINIKSFLMNSHIIAGIGNIYATEALFSAKIHPESKVNLLTLNQMNAIVKAIKKILNQAIKRGGTTLRNFVNGDGKPGYFSNKLKAYGREGLPCLECGDILLSIRIAQRSTVYCKNCQKNK